MNCCKNCKYYCRLEEVKPFPGGAQVVFLDGFVCMQKLEENGKVRWYSDSNENTYCCDKFVSK